MPPARRSTRSRKGSGWHKKGYRDHGNMWINIRRAMYGGPFVRGHEVNECATMQEFLDGVIRDISMEEDFPIPEDWLLDVQRRGKSLFLEPMDAPVTDYFDGGEQITCKVFDDEGIR
ncbi:hypothetical protein GLOTRDRAFT_126274 [Gloeophyllum trabeum ATCC 11539]|uniref:Uncharacterized protein n=1 Tax=Gloeophyllum trabeum (strain ATCC 11539 / FP-39264 / Madison 617) TaxID=670483 RepID=S7QEQ8_GLOTA|nr:uncharacterized protein GLOTRDRAFT_126274 [Gloeophyllum trabeum ATCC 11539]EPQ57783.1 hypothetical protein GLOTRDRAFT_126274 [Gloeophyllum trabeum ATCC 11539]